MGSRKGKRNGKDPGFWRPALVSTVQAFLIAAVLVEPSLGTIGEVGLLPAFAIILAIILVGVVFDIVGVAAAAADEHPFHAMAAKRIPGARQAIALVRRADRVATFAVDLVGETTAAISGAAGAAVVFRLASGHALREDLAGTLVIGGIAAVTVGAKAAVKGLAIRRANEIIFLAGRVIHAVTSPRRLPFRRGRGLPRRKGPKPRGRGDV